MPTSPRASLIGLPTLRASSCDSSSRCWSIADAILRIRMARARDVVVTSQTTHVLPLEFNKLYPVLKRGDGVWVEDESGKRYLDAMSGGSMAATLGHGRKDIIEAARKQAEKLAYVHNERLTNPAQEQLARQLIDVAPAGFTRVRFVTGGAEANELALKLARSYHVERGEPNR